MEADAELFDLDVDLVTASNTEGSYSYLRDLGVEHYEFDDVSVASVEGTDAGKYYSDVPLQDNPEAYFEELTRESLRRKNRKPNSESKKSVDEKKRRNPSRQVEETSKNKRVSFDTTSSGTDENPAPPKPSTSGSHSVSSKKSTGASPSKNSSKGAINSLVPQRKTKTSKGKQVLSVSPDNNSNNIRYSQNQSKQQSSSSLSHTVVHQEGGPSASGIREKHSVQQRNGHSQYNRSNIPLSPLSPSSKSKARFKFPSFDGLVRPKKDRGTDTAPQDIIYAFDDATGQQTPAEWDDNVHFGINKKHSRLAGPSAGNASARPNDSKRERVKQRASDRTSESLVISDTKPSVRTRLKDEQLTETSSKNEEKSVFHSRKNNRLRIDIPSIDIHDTDARLAPGISLSHSDDAPVDAPVSSTGRVGVTSRPPSGANVGSFTRIRELHESGRLVETISTVQDLQLTPTPTVKRTEETPTGLFLLAAQGKQEDLEKGLSALPRHEIMALRDHHGNTLLHLATSNGNQDCVALLSSEYAEMIGERNKAKLTAMIVAIKHGQVLCVDWMLENIDGIDELQPDSQERSLLHYAAKFGQDGCLRLLLAHVAKHAISLDLCDQNGNTPAHLAAKYGHLTCIQTLVEFGHDVCVSNSYGHTPCYYADFSSQRHCAGYLMIVEMCRQMAREQTTLLRQTRQDEPLHGCAKECLATGAVAVQRYMDSQEAIRQQQQLLTEYQNLQTQMTLQLKEMSNENDALKKKFNGIQVKDATSTDRISEAVKQSKRLTSKYLTTSQVNESDSSTMTLELSARMKELEGRLALHDEGPELTESEVEREVKGIMSKRLSESHQRLAVFRSSVQSLKFNRPSSNASSPPNSEVTGSSGSSNNSGIHTGNTFSFNRRVISRRGDMAEYFHQKSAGYSPLGPVPKSPHKKKPVLRPITIPTSHPAPLLPEPSTDATAEEVISPVETSTPYTEVLTPGGGSGLIADVRNLRAHHAQSNENRNQDSAAENSSQDKPGSSQSDDDVVIPAVTDDADMTLQEVPSPDLPVDDGSTASAAVDLHSAEVVESTVISGKEQLDQSALSYNLSDKDFNHPFDTGSDSNISFTSLSSDKASPAMPTKMKITRNDFKETYQRPLHLNPPRGTSTPDGSTVEFSGREDTESSGPDDFLASTALSNLEKKSRAQHGVVGETLEDHLLINVVADLNAPLEMSSSSSAKTNSSQNSDDQENHSKFKRFPSSPHSRDIVMYVRNTNNSSGADSSGDNQDFWDDLSDIGTASDVDGEDGYPPMGSGDYEYDQGDYIDVMGGGGDQPMYVSKSLLQARALRYECSLSVIDEVSIISTPEQSGTDSELDVNDDRATPTPDKHTVVPHVEKRPSGGVKFPPRPSHSPPPPPIRSSEQPRTVDKVTMVKKQVSKTQRNSREWYEVSDEEDTLPRQLVDSKFNNTSLTSSQVSLDQRPSQTACSSSQSHAQLNTSRNNNSQSHVTNMKSRDPVDQSRDEMQPIISGTSGDLLVNQTTGQSSAESSVAITSAKTTDKDSNVPIHGTKTNDHYTMF